MLKRILYIANILVVLVLLGTYAGSFVRPEVAPLLSLFNYLYPFALIVNVLFCILWLFLKWRFLFVPLGAMILGADYIPRMIGMNAGSDAKGESLRVMTYNVANFSYESQNTNELRKRNIDSIAEVIKAENPDVLCLQEYSTPLRGQYSLHACLKDKLGYSYHYSPWQTKSAIRGCTIYSKYPITRSGCPFPMKEQFYSFAFADIKHPFGIVRVYNVHLTSYGILEEEKSEIGELKKGNVPTKQTSLSVKDKLIEANKVRAEETRQLVEVLQQTNHKYIVAGDFNSTPYSYTYREMTKLTNDSFRKAGRGLSGTYNGPLPSYRIDYLFYSDGLKPLNYLCGDYLFSDHKPVIAEFEFEKEK